MIPFVMSFDDFVLDDEGTPKEYIYKLQYFNNFYYVRLPKDFDDMSVSQKQGFVLGSFTEAFQEEQQAKLDECPEDMIHTVLYEPDDTHALEDIPLDRLYDEINRRIAEEDPEDTE